MKNKAALFQATFAAILTFLFVDAAVEKIIHMTSGVSILQIFESECSTHYGARFHLINGLLFSAEMFIVIFLYGELRPRFQSQAKPVILTTVIFVLISILFLLQMVNLGIYPLQSALLFSLSTAVGFPASVLCGAFVYDRIVYRR